MIVAVKMTGQAEV